MAYEVNVSVACQFDDTGWDYLDRPVATKCFVLFEDALDAYYEMLGIDTDEVAKEFHAKFPECMAFEAETSITEAGYDFSETRHGEFFDNERIWTAEGWED